MATVGVKGLLSSLSLNFLVRLIASNIRPDVQMTVSYRTRLGGTDALADTTVALLMREHSSSCFLDTKVAVYMCTKAVFIGLARVTMVCHKDRQWHAAILYAPIDVITATI